MWFWQKHGDNQLVRFFYFFWSAEVDQKPLRERGVNTGNDVLGSEGLPRRWAVWPASDSVQLPLRSPPQSLISPPTPHCTPHPHQPIAPVQFQLKPFRASLFSHLLSRESRINKSMNPASTGLWAWQEPVFVFFSSLSPCQSKETLISWNTLMHCVMHRRMFIKLFSNESHRIDSGARWFMQHPRWLLPAMLICAIGRCERRARGPGMYIKTNWYEGGD